MPVPSKSGSLSGHEIDEVGIHPTKEKVEAISEAPAPTSVTKIKSFLGLVNFYAKLLSGTTTVLEPLYRLLRNEAKWE